MPRGPGPPGPAPAPRRPRSPVTSPSRTLHSHGHSCSRGRGGRTRPGAAGFRRSAGRTTDRARFQRRCGCARCIPPCLSRAKSLKDERNIVAELPAGDPLDDATVLLIGRGRHHPTLSVAVGERMGVMGALSIDQGARCLKAREIDGIVIGDGLPAGLGRGLPHRAGGGRALSRPAGCRARRS